MSIRRPFNIKSWIDENRHLLKPPVANQAVYKENEDFIVMVVGGPNKRKDFHFNEGEEFFYQLEGDMVLRVMEDGKPVDFNIKEGDVFLLPPRIPHSPQRNADTVGIVIERYRKQGELDRFIWYCENCNEKLHEEAFQLTDIVSQLPPIMQAYYDSEEQRTCDNCGTVMEPPS